MSRASREQQQQLKHSQQSAGGQCCSSRTAEVRKCSMYTQHLRCLAPLPLLCAMPPCAAAHLKWLAKQRSRQGHRWLSNALAASAAVLPAPLADALPVPPLGSRWLPPLAVDAADALSSAASCLRGAEWWGEGEARLRIGIYSPYRL